MHHISSHMIPVLSGWTNLRCFSPEARFHMPALSGSQNRGFLVPLSDNMKLGVLLLSTVTQTHFLFSFPISWFYILSIDSSALIENWPSRYCFIADHPFSISILASFLRWVCIQLCSETFLEVFPFSEFKRSKNSSLFWLKENPSLLHKEVPEQLICVSFTHFPKFLIDRLTTFLFLIISSVCLNWTNIHMI